MTTALIVWRAPLDWSAAAWEETLWLMDHPPIVVVPNTDYTACMRTQIAYDDGAYKALHRVRDLDLGKPTGRVGEEIVEQWYRSRMPDYHETRDYLVHECGFDETLAAVVCFGHFFRKFGQGNYFLTF